MNLKNRFLFKAAIGFSLGVLVTIMINIICGALENGNAVTYLDDLSSIRYGRSHIRVMLELLTGGLLGLIGNGGAVVYEIESWGILKATTVHFVMTMLAFFIIGVFNGWLTPRLSLVNVIMTCIMIFVYLAIWLIQYFVYKREIDIINSDIKLLKSKEDT